MWAASGRAIDAATSQSRPRRASTAVLLGERQVAAVAANILDRRFARDNRGGNHWAAEHGPAPEESREAGTVPGPRTGMVDMAPKTNRPFVGYSAMTDSETIALRITVIGGQSYADDFTVIWRGICERTPWSGCR